MEDSSITKVEKLESFDQEKEVGVKEAKDVEFERVIATDVNSESVNGTHEDGHNEIGSVEEDLEKLEEKELIESLVDSVDPVASLTVSDKASPAVTDMVANKIEETAPQSSDTDGFYTAETDVESNRSEKTIVASTEENMGLNLVVTIDVVSEEVEETNVTSKGIEEQKLPDSNENTAGVVDQPLLGSADSAAAAAAAADITQQHQIPESTENPPIISLSQRTVQPTSWRSCCGLFEALRRQSRR